MDWDKYYDPPDEQVVIALKHKKCGKFIKTQPVGYVPPSNPRDEWDEGHKLYHCAHCRRDIPESEVRVIEA